VQELGGLVFAYVGPQPAPLLPKWAPLNWDNCVHDIAITVLPCNWLQCQENSLDPVHAEWLHGHYAGWVREFMGQDEETMAQFRRQVRTPHQKIAFNEFKYGIIKRRLVQGADENHDDWKTGHPVFFPNILLVGTPAQTTLQFRVPIDESHTFHVSLYTWHAAPGKTAPHQDRVPYRYVELKDENGDFAYQTLTFNQDYMSWVTQGPVADRDLEKLGESDLGIILFRRQLKQQLELVRDGGEPMNVFRSPGSDIITDVPLENLKHGAKSAYRPRKYVPGEGGYSEGAEQIEQVLATYIEPEPQLAG
jgi:5,5'-dehydrodivanillate O-demethylase oxygenase subunit